MIRLFYKNKLFCIFIYEYEYVNCITYLYCYFISYLFNSYYLSLSYLSYFEYYNIIDIYNSNNSNKFYKSCGDALIIETLHPLVLIRWQALLLVSVAETQELHLRRSIRPAGQQRLIIIHGRPMHVDGRRLPPDDGISFQ